MASDAAPNDVWIARPDLLAVLESRPAVGRPGELPHTALTPDAFDAQLRIKLLGTKTGDESADRVQERLALLACQSLVLAQEPLALGVRGHPPSYGSSAGGTLSR